MTTLTGQLSDLKNIKIDAVEAGEQAMSRVEELVEQQRQIDVERLAAQQRQRALDEQLKEEVKCCICLETIVNAVSLSTCPHRFCDGCIRDALRATSKCPLCSQPARPRTCRQTRC